MVVSIRAGLRAETGFKKAVWLEVLKKIITEFFFQSILTIKQLTTKLQWYKTKWKKWLIFNNFSGWVWNPVAELHTTDDKTWIDHLVVRVFFLIIKFIYKKYEYYRVIQKHNYYNTIHFIIESNMKNYFMKTLL